MVGRFLQGQLLHLTNSSNPSRDLVHLLISITPIITGGQTMCDDLCRSVLDRLTWRFRPVQWGGWRTTATFPDPPLSLAPSLPPRLESLSQEWCPSQQSHAGFFQLPLELRQRILREAFGDRTLHLDVRARTSMHVLMGPREANRCKGNALKMHRPGARGWRRLAPWFSPKEYKYGWHSNESLEALPAWRWEGCFCHAGKVIWNDPRRRDVLCSRGLEPLFYDGCWRGKAWCCDEDGDYGVLPDDARVGAMGFLLSCKRA